MTQIALQNKIILIASLFILMAISAFFSAAETAYTSINLIKIETAVKKGSRTSKLVKKHLNSFGWTLSTILIGNNIVNIASSTLLSFLLGSFMNQAKAAIITIVIMTPIIVLFGEIVPKLIAKKYPWGYIKKVVWLLEILNWIFSPFTFLLSKMTFKSKVTYTEQEIKTMITIASNEGVLQKGEATLAINALDMDSKKTSEVMVSRKNVITIEHDATKESAMKIFSKSGFSRLPIMKGKNWIGILHLKDLIDSNSKYILPPSLDASVPYVSKNTLITKALEDMRSMRTHMAFVKESKNQDKVIGIITIEDVLETLIGKIYDEHDEKKLIIAVGLHKFRVNEHALMKDLSIEIGFDFKIDDENIDVLSWLKRRLKRSVKKNLKYTYQNKVIFKIIKNKQSADKILEIKTK